jgi:hypothetical protein
MLIHEVLHTLGLREAPAEGAPRSAAAPCGRKGRAPPARRRVQGEPVERGAQWLVVGKRMRLEIVSSEKPRLRYLVGPQAKSVTRLRRFLPAAMYEQGVRRTFALDESA